MIKLVQRKDIDDDRWNSIIAGSKFETIYPYTWYMDLCADKWMGLVMQDYECIMPVAFRKKYTLKYFYQPFFNQQLGVFSLKSIDNEIVRMFLNAMIHQFKMGEYAFNTGNLLGEENGVEVIDRTNYELGLDDSYEALYSNFAHNTRRNIRRAYKADLEVRTDISAAEIIALKRSDNPVRRKNEHYEWMENLFGGLVDKKKAVVYGIRKGDSLLAASLFAFSKTRAIYLLSVSSGEGKELRAMFQIVDAFIRDHAERNMKLDFEGSSIASIARFFAGFGAKPTIYQRVKYQSLPAGLSKMKRNG